MRTMFRLNLLISCTCFVFGIGWGPRISAAETNSPPVTDAAVQKTLNGYLQVQEQLHAMQLAIESNRQEIAVTAQHNSDDMAARIQLLEQIITAQRNSEVEVAQKSQQLTLMLAGVGMVGLAVLLLMVYFQLRAVMRLVELSASHSAALMLGGSRGLPVVETAGRLAAPARAAVELSNMRLLGVVEHLEKRILELEQTARARLNETASPAARGQHGAHPPSGDGDTVPHDQRVANLIAEGQSLLDANEPGKALGVFDKVLAIRPKHTGALIRKGSALEKLSRFDEAVACYDRAIEADGSTTIAYLHKGGLFNRLARYDEALQCYEQALRTQEKTPLGKRVAP
jgi:tetratricopeptide (TPR) repeat protein